MACATETDEVEKTEIVAGAAVKCVKDSPMGIRCLCNDYANLN